MDGSYSEKHPPPSSGFHLRVTVAVGEDKGSLELFRNGVLTILRNHDPGAYIIHNESDGVLDCFLIHADYGPFAPKGKDAYPFIVDLTRFGANVTIEELDPLPHKTS